LIHVEHAVLPLVRGPKPEHGEWLRLQALDKTQIGLFPDEGNISHGDDEAVTIDCPNEFSGSEKGAACSVQDRLLTIRKTKRARGLHHLLFPVVHDRGFGSGRQALDDVQKDGMRSLKRIAARHKGKERLVAPKTLHAAPAARGHDDRSD
jgi:hypothetical protein